MIQRTIQTQLKKLASMYPVVTITGPRQSGKTTLAKMTFPNYRYVSLENFDVRQMADMDPRGFLKNCLFTRICGRNPVPGVRQAGDISTLLQF